jgi:hypothetical protein
MWHESELARCAAVGVEQPVRGYELVMAKYELNERAVAHARDLIAKRQYVVKSKWGDVQPSAEDENTFLEPHSWDEYALWHLGLTVEVPTRRRPDTRSCSATSGAFIGRR